MSSNSTLSCSHRRVISPADRDDRPGQRLGRQDPRRGGRHDDCLFAALALPPHTRRGQRSRPAQSRDAHGWRSLLFAAQSLQSLGSLLRGGTSD